MALSVEDILKAIDNMDIYKKDYDIIQSLLETGDNKLFTEIIETFEKLSARQKKNLIKDCF